LNISSLVLLLSSVPTMSSINPMYSEGSPYMSKTHQYRKVMKPLIERKRRARIN
ncbi:Enhancer of split mbeta protein, partial [Caligus rogercresseyi]